MVSNAFARSMNIPKMVCVLKFNRASDVPLFFWKPNWHGVIISCCWIKFWSCKLTILSSNLENIVKLRLDDSCYRMIWSSCFYVGLLSEQISSKAAPHWMCAIAQIWYHACELKQLIGLIWRTNHNVDCWMSNLHF